jgi:hypothetical protein
MLCDGTSPISPYRSSPPTAIFLATSNVTSFQLAVSLQLVDDTILNFDSNANCSALKQLFWSMRAFDAHSAPL